MRAAAETTTAPDTETPRAAPPATTSAESDTPSPAAAERGRVLHGHHFLPADVVSDPFLSTYFDTSTGLGVSTLRAPEFDLSGQFVPSSSTTYNLANLEQRLKLQIDIFDWVAIRGELRGSAYTGTDATAALVFGATAGYEYTLGLAGRVFRGDWLLVSALADYQHANNIGLSPLSALNEALSGGILMPSLLFTKTSVDGVRGGLALALAPHPSIGFWGLFRVAWQQLDLGDREDSSWGMTASGALSFDLGALSPVPIGALVSYRHDQTWVTYHADGASSGSGEPVGWWSFGLFYTGRADLTLGLELDMVAQSLATDFEVSQYVGLYRMRYYW